MSCMWPFAPGVSVSQPEKKPCVIQFYKFGSNEDLYALSARGRYVKYFNKSYLSFDAQKLF